MRSHCIWNKAIISVCSKGAPSALYFLKKLSSIMQIKAEKDELMNFVLYNINVPLQHLQVDDRFHRVALVVTRCISCIYSPNSDNSKRKAKPL